MRLLALLGLVLLVSPAHADDDLDARLAAARAGRGEARRKAVLALGRDIPDARRDEVLKQLRAWLIDDRDPFIRMASAETLVALRGRDARESLEVALAKERIGGHTGVRARLEQLLHELRPLIEWKALVEALRKADPGSEQLRLLSEVARHPAAKSYTLLAHYLKHDPDPAVRRHALALAVRSAPSRGLSAAEGILAGETEPVSLRAAAAEVLVGNAPTARAEAALRKALGQSPPPALLRAIVRAIRLGGLQSFTDDLVARLPEAPPALNAELVHALCALAVAAKDRRRLTALVDRLGAVPPLEKLPYTLASELVRTLGRHGSQAHGQQLAAQFADLRQLELMTDVAEAIGRIGAPGADRVLIARLPGAPTPQLQAAIMIGLSRSRAVALWPRVAPLFERVEDQRALRTVAYYIGAVAPPAAGGAALARIGRREGNVRHVLRDLLTSRGWLGPGAGVAQLIDGLASPDPALVKAAAASLRRMIPHARPDEVDRMLDALADLDGVAHDVLTRTVAFGRHPQTIARMPGMLGRARGEDRSSLLHGLAILGVRDSAALALARASLTDKTASRELRLAALAHLGHVGELSDAKAIARLGDEAVQIRSERTLFIVLGCCQAMALLGAPEQERVRRWVTKVGAHPRWGPTAYQYFTTMPGDAVRDHLITDLGGRVTGRLRAIAARALGHRREGYEALLKAAQGDQRDYVRLESLRALGDCGDARAVEPLIALYERHGEDKALHTMLRNGAAEALGQLGGERARAFLLSRIPGAIGTPHAETLLAATGRAGGRVPGALIRRAVQAAPGPIPLSYGARALAGDPAASAWLWRDTRSPLSIHQHMAHLALRERGDKRYVTLVLRRATLDPFPRWEVRRIAERLEGAPPVTATDRPAQDKQLAALTEWWKEHGEAVRWDPTRRRFVKE